MFTKIKYITIALLAGGLMAACSDSSGPELSDGGDDDIVTIDANTTELKGAMRGTLLRGRTYQMVGDMIILPDEEIRVESGVTIVAHQDAASGIGFEITNEGSFIAQVQLLSLFC